MANAKKRTQTPAKKSAKKIFIYIRDTGHLYGSRQI